MGFTVRIQGGSHDTMWDEVEIIEGGWLRCKSYEKNDRTEGSRVIEERWYPPTSVYSVQPLR